MQSSKSLVRPTVQTTNRTCGTVHGRTFRPPTQATHRATPIRPDCLPRVCGLCREARTLNAAFAAVVLNDGLPTDGTNVVAVANLWHLCRVVTLECRSFSPTHFSRSPAQRKSALIPSINLERGESRACLSFSATKVFADTVQTVRTLVPVWL
jgi:hypothetical protein